MPFPAAGAAGMVTQHIGQAEAHVLEQTQSSLLFHTFPRDLVPQRHHRGICGVLGKFKARSFALQWNECT